MFCSNRFPRIRALLFCLGVVFVSVGASAEASNAQQQTDATKDQRLLPLAGGSNFRDMGGYATEDNKTVRRGVLFRSGVMTNLTEADETFLERYDFAAVVDLRSDEELALYPNHWVEHNPNIDYRHHSYSIAKMIAAAKGPDGETKFQPEEFYRAMPRRLQPQLKLYFDALLQGEGAVVVNCSAGQDRTGFASAVLLSALGVPRDVVVEDYLLSTQYRRPDVELGEVDLRAAAKHNAFAKMMLRYTQGDKERKPQPLVTADGTPFIVFALDEIQRDYGSTAAYLETLGLTEADLNTLRQLYLTQNSSR